MRKYCVANVTLMNNLGIMYTNRGKKWKLCIRVTVLIRDFPAEFRE